MFKIYCLKSLPYYYATFYFLNKIIKKYKIKKIYSANNIDSNLSIIKEIKKLGLGAEVVSKGELAQALNAWVNPKQIVFSGVGKSHSELKYAIEKKICSVKYGKLPDEIPNNTIYETIFLFDVLFVFLIIPLKKLILVFHTALFFWFW